MKSVLLRRGRVIDPASGLDAVRDVLIEGGRIERIGQRLTRTGSGTTIDLDGFVVCPGFIDMHVHLREPGQESKETIAAGCAAAATSGFTAVAAMANTLPVNDCRAITELIVDEAKRHGSVRVYPVGAVTKGLLGEELAEIGEMVSAGVVAISDDGRPIGDSGIMRRALQWAQIYGIPVLVHEQDESLVGKGVVHEGETSARLGLPGWPGAGEDVMIARDLILAEDVRGRLHLQHLTTARGLTLVQAAKKRGVNVTCEVTPHHLTLTDAVLESFDTLYKMNPPLRPESDRLALLKALRDTVDVIATDHAPHTEDEKNAEFCCAPFGVVGLESAVPVLLTKIVNEAGLPLSRLIELLSAGPAQALGVPGGSLAAGEPADITVLDLERESIIDASRFRSKGRNTCFAGWRTKGAPVMTIVAGRIVHDAR
ncbi:MAG: dihydroorotase [Acidobacteriota bacterium]